jgi:hypothetical protein
VTDAPTILVKGGSLTLRHDTVQESTGYNDAAIAVSGGNTLDLGTVASPGGNTVNVNGSGSFVRSTGVNFVTAVGSMFESNGASVFPLATINLASSANPSLLNQPVTFTATVGAPNAGSAAPTGSMTFVDQTTGSTLANVPLSGGSARWALSPLALGAHTIAAVYSGDANYISSTTFLVQQVQYHFSGFLPPLSQNMPFALNRTIPVKFQLADANGHAITSLAAVTSLQIQALDANGNPVGAPFNPTAAGGTALRFDGNQFIFNWQTKGRTSCNPRALENPAPGRPQGALSPPCARPAPIRVPRSAPARRPHRGPPRPARAPGGPAPPGSTGRRRAGEPASPPCRRRSPTTGSGARGRGRGT